MSSTPATYSPVLQGKAVSTGMKTGATEDKKTDATEPQKIAAPPTAIKSVLTPRGNSSKRNQSVPDCPVSEKLTERPAKFRKIGGTGKGKENENENENENDVIPALKVLHNGNSVIPTRGPIRAASMASPAASFTATTATTTATTTAATETTADTTKYAATHIHGSYHVYHTGNLAAPRDLPPPMHAPQFVPFFEHAVEVGARGNVRMESVGSALAAALSKVVEAEVGITFDDISTVALLEDPRDAEFLATLGAILATTIEWVHHPRLRPTTNANGVELDLQHSLRQTWEALRAFGEITYPGLGQASGRVRAFFRTKQAQQLAVRWSDCNLEPCSDKGVQSRLKPGGTLPSSQPDTASRSTRRSKTTRRGGSVATTKLPDVDLVDTSVVVPREDLGPGRSYRRFCPLEWLVLSAIRSHNRDLYGWARPRVRGPLLLKPEDEPSWSFLAMESDRISRKLARGE